ncbi:MAG: S41 family peptidase [Clostridiales bacterium]|nr:S41 family peptidase [Clostridiales bacterium]
MKRKIALGCLVILLLASLVARDEDFWGESLEKYSTLLSLIETNYFNQVDPEQLVFSSIRGVLETLDPHSYFLDPASFSRMREEYTGKYYGLGIQIQKQGDNLVVISPLEGSPASRLGIQPGDIISHINGESTKPISSFDAMQKLRGPKGTEVTITLVREGLEAPFDLTIERAEIPLRSVPYAFMITKDVGWIFIRNFAETTAEEFEEKMAKLIGQGMKSLILDLRNNTGGPFFQSVEIADLFLPKGSAIVSIKGRNKLYNREFRAQRDGQYENIPLVVLINRGSASASEIVSGAVMDNDRGFIVGEDSWGKGLVQTVFPLGENLALALTTAKYYTPSGRSIQRDYAHIEDYILYKKAPEDEREVRYTAKGRKVLGQGGISPDFETESGRNLFILELMNKGAFFGYARKFAGRQTPRSKTTVFLEEEGEEKGFVVDSRIIEDFKTFLRTNKIAFSEERFQEVESEIKRELEREIYSSIWGTEAGVRVYQKSDPAVLKALEVMSEASKFVADNQSP